MNDTIRKALKRAQQELRPVFPELTVEQLNAGARWALAQDKAQQSLEPLSGRPPPAGQGRLLKRDEVCARLGIKPRKYWLMIQQGLLPHVKLGARSTRVPEWAVDWMATRVPRLEWHRPRRLRGTATATKAAITVPAPDLPQLAAGKEG